MPKVSTIPRELNLIIRFDCLPARNFGFIVAEKLPNPVFYTALKGAKKYILKGGLEGGSVITNL